MEIQNEFRNLLRGELGRRKAGQPGYSQGLFAQSLGIHPAALSEFLRAKRQFSKKKLRQILNRLNLNEEQAETFKIRVEQTQSQHKKVLKSQVIGSELYFLNADPLYFALYSLIESDNFQSDPNWMAGRLNTSVQEIEKKLQVLINLKLVEKTETRYQAIATNLESLDGIPSDSIKERHFRNAEDAKKAIFEQPIDRRFFSSETLIFDPDDLPLVNKKINDFLDDIVFISQRGRNRTEVYEFCAHYFARTSLSDK